ncbi:AAA family ATPase [bacterium]|nr:AAA family ATPase [bacterium]
MFIKIPELSLVLLVGTSSSGKSSFANRFFKSYEVVSSDYYRAIVSNNENNQKATKDAFELLHYTVAKRLKNALLTVVDATNLFAKDRLALLKIAKRYHFLPVAIVFNIDPKICEERDKKRVDRNVGEYVINAQYKNLRNSLKKLKYEGFKQIHILKSPEDVNSIDKIVRDKLNNDKKDIKGPFDIIGDLHGCYDELVELLQKLGYIIKNSSNYFDVYHPEGRVVLFLGDLVDRGPDSPSVLKLVMSMVKKEIAFSVPGNHDIKLLDKLNGKNVNLSYGLEVTLEQLKKESIDFIAEVKDFIFSLVSHYIFDGGKLVVSHAGLKEELQGRVSDYVRDFCLYGDTTGEFDEIGLPIRLNWAKDYHGEATVVYGHSPVLEAEWYNNTINIDTGAVFGGKLTALRYPELEIVSVNAKKIYRKPAKPLGEYTLA